MTSGHKGPEPKEPVPMETLLSEDVIREYRKSVSELTADEAKTIEVILSAEKLSEDDLAIRINARG